MNRKRLNLVLLLGVFGVLSACGSDNPSEENANGSSSVDNAATRYAESLRESKGSARESVAEYEKEAQDRQEIYDQLKNQ